jgi:UDP-N-acetylglucosamine:LPS N-acetylglucosamine transferase
VLPYPWHKDRHQARNAAPLETRGAALVLDDPVVGDDAIARLKTTLGELLTERSRLDAMRATFPPPAEDPAAKLARAILGE